MKESYLKKLMEMRLVVSFLGERTQFSWWPTSFYEASSRLFLEPVFSKTSRLAQYHGVLEAARLLHDDHLSVGCYHLFRLPEEFEQDLHLIMLDTLGHELVDNYLLSKEAALDGLKCMANSKTQTIEGPIYIGNIKDIGTIDTLQAIAGAYQSAFSRNVKIYPYMAG